MRFINGNGESDRPPSNTAHTINYTEAYFNNTPIFAKNRKGLEIEKGGRA